MVGKKYRLPVQKFPRGAKSAYNGKLFVVKSSANMLLYSRVGVIISKSVVKKATHRNKIRRLVVDAFRDNKKILKKAGTDHLVVISSSGKLDGADYAELKEEILAALAKLQK